MRRSVEHGTFTIERVYRAAPPRVFAAWANAETKRRWTSCHDDWKVLEYDLDFRVGGHERQRTQPPGGPVHRLEARYVDVVADERIVYDYEMFVGDALISASLVTVELRPGGDGTRMVFTEHVVSIDGGCDLAEREEGTAVGLDRLHDLFA
jgi:uncharacterized protein YndB with AHSA1/START domain